MLFTFAAAVVPCSLKPPEQNRAAGSCCLSASAIVLSSYSLLSVGFESQPVSLLVRFLVRGDLALTAELARLITVAESYCWLFLSNKGVATTAGEPW